MIAACSLIWVYASPASNTKEAVYIYMLIELTEGLWIESDNVTAVRESTLDDDQTIIWCIGQSAVDGGFTVDLPATEVVETINQAKYMALVKSLELESDHDRADRAARVEQTG